MSAHQFAFAYTVRITNQGQAPAQLRSRHWIITDGNGNVQEVRGEGVVGEQPLIQPGQHFEYTSWCVIATASGVMRGSYSMRQRPTWPTSSTRRSRRFGWGCHRRSTRCVAGRPAHWRPEGGDYMLGTWRRG